MARKTTKRRTTADHGVGATHDERNGVGSMRCLLAGTCAGMKTGSGFMSMIDTIVQTEIARAKGKNTPVPDLSESGEQIYSEAVDRIAQHAPA